MKEIASTDQAYLADWISNEVIQHSECIRRQNALVDATNELYKSK